MRGWGGTQTEKFTAQADVGPTYSTKLTPSLGQFRLGAVVNLTKPDRSMLVTGKITDLGSVTLTYAASYTGPIIVTVMGGSGVTYFDEKDGSYPSFDVGSKLKAVLPAPQKEAGVTALTNAAPKGTSTASFAEILAIVLKDSKLDAKYGSLELYYVKTDPKKTLPELMVPAYQEAAKEYATADSEKVAALAPMMLTSDLTWVNRILK